MNEVVLCSNIMPVMCGCDYLAASEPFYHADRTAPFHVMIYVTKGNIYVTEDDTDYVIGAGEMLFLKSGIRHYGKEMIQRGTEWYYIHFSCDEQELPDFIPDAAPLPQHTAIKSCLRLPKQLHGLSGGNIERGLSQLCELCRSDDSFKQWNINHTLFSLLSQIALQQLTNESRMSLSDNICSFLSENYRKPFSADKLSRTFFLSYKRLAAIFKSEKGITMQQYHTTVRMNEACRLLRSTLMPVGEIASAVGYSDPLYFSRRFHDKTGCSPTEYRTKSQIF